MPPVINPRSIGAHEARRLIARQSAASDPGPRTGIAWGLLRARMEERVLPPGGVERSRLVWMRCDNSPCCGNDDCRKAGKCLSAGGIVLPCSRCWDAEKVEANLTIIGPLTAPLGIECKRCGGRDSEVQADIGIPPGYTEAMARIAEWNTTIDQRAERRKQCVTPFDWLPLWHPGVSWR